MRRARWILGAAAAGVGMWSGCDGHAAHPDEPADLDEHAGHARGGAALPDGHAEVRIAADRQQLIGLRLGRAERGVVAGTVRASAVVQPDETREAHVHVKIAGWIEKLHVAAVGERVRRGQPLYSIYSQDFYVAQQEYLRARETHPELAAAARERLRLWDVSPAELARLEREGPRHALTIRSPIAGTVLERGALVGHYVAPDTMLFRIADLSRVWILAAVYEYEVDRIDSQATASVLVQGHTEPIEAAVDYVYPTVDPASRTVRIRLVAPNRDGRLRPGSFAVATLPTRAVEQLFVPEEAVIDTGLRQVIYVARGGGWFRPVEVRIGRRDGGRAEVLMGLEGGEEVVIGAQFLLDSESRIRATSGPGPGHGAH